MGALFHPQIASEPGRKRAPPQTYVCYFQFLSPISVAVMSTLSHEINLCPIDVTPSLPLARQVFAWACPEGTP